ncbi:MAG: iron ABC transporter permease [Kineosporiaceae bacterium]
MTVLRPPPSKRPAVPLTAVLVAALVLAVALSVAVGARPVPPDAVWRALWHDDGSVEAGLVRDLRVPRTALALAVGAGLAVSGSLLQAVTGNPLADPGLLGVTSGAALGVVTALAAAGVTTASGQVWFALAGALAATAVVMALGGRAGSVQRQVLAGVAVTAAGSAAVSAIATARPQVLDRFRFWNVGSLAERGLGDLGQVLPFLLVGLVLALALGPALNAMALGDAGARGLGVPVVAVRLAALLAVALLCAGATSLAGPLSVLGLAVPHAVRALAGADRRRELLGCLLAGPAVLLVTDVIGRVASPPGELQVGVVTAAVGAPVFLALVARRRVAVR